MILRFLPWRRRALEDNRRFWIVTWVAALGAGFVSLLVGLQQSIWFDEAYSVVVAKHSVGDIVHLVSLDTHPPLYYLLLHWWGNLFAWHEVALRLLSILAFVGAVMVAGLLIRRLFGARAATVAVIIVALGPLLMRYGFEIRMYALASLIGVTATYVLVVAREKSRWWLWALYGLAVVLGMYTLYYLAMLWIAHLVWLAYATYKKGRLKQFYREPWFLAYVGSVVVFLPWLPSFLKQAGSDALAPIGQPMNLENLVGIATFNSVYQPTWQLGMVATLAFLALAWALGYLTIQAAKVVKRSEKRALGLFALYIAIPVLILVVISFARSMYVERYLSQVAIGLMMLVGIVVALALRTPTQMVRLTSAVVVAVLLFGVVHLVSVGNFNFQRMEHPTVQRVADALGDCGSDQAVAAAGPYEMIELSSVLPTSCDLHFYSSDEHLSGGYAPLDGSTQQFKTTEIPALAQTIHYVHYGDAQLTAPAGYQLTNQQTFGALTLATYQANVE